MPYLGSRLPCRAQTDGCAAGAGDPCAQRGLGRGHGQPGQDLRRPEGLLLAAWVLCGRHVARQHNEGLGELL